MTVATSTNKVTYNCNGSVTEFDFSFKIFETSDIKVTLRYTDPSTGVITDVVLIENSGYTVTADNNDFTSGGTVTTIGATPYSSDYKLIIRREVPVTQEIDYVEGGDFPAESHEDGLDRATMVSQQLDEVIDRALVFPAAETLSGELPNSAARADKFFTFDAGGLPDVTTFSTTQVAANTANITAILAGIASTEFVETQARLEAAVTAASAPHPITIIMRESTDAGNVYLIAADYAIPAYVTLMPLHGAMFSVDVSKTLTVNGKLAAGDYQIFSGSGAVAIGAQVRNVLAEWWGAAGDGVTDDSTAIQAALDTGHAVDITGKTYSTGTTSLVMDSGEAIWGDGILIYAGTGDMIKSASVDTDTLDENIEIDGPANGPILECTGLNATAVHLQRARHCRINFRWSPKYRRQTGVLLNGVRYAGGTNMGVYWNYFRITPATHRLTGYTWPDSQDYQGNKYYVLTGGANITVTGRVGTFSVGEVLRGDWSNARFIITEESGDDLYGYFHKDSPAVFDTSEPVRGETSGATATLPATIHGLTDPSGLPNENTIDGCSTFYGGFGSFLLGTRNVVQRMDFEGGSPNVGIGAFVQGAANFFHNIGIELAAAWWLTISNLGTTYGFRQGELVTGSSSGAIGTVMYICNGDGSTAEMMLLKRGGTFTAADTLTGGTSGQTADVDVASDRVSGIPAIFTRAAQGVTMSTYMGSPAIPFTCVRESQYNSAPLFTYPYNPGIGSASGGWRKLALMYSSAISDSTEIYREKGSDIVTAALHTGADFRLNNFQFCDFRIQIANDAGTLKHRIASTASTTAASLFAGAFNNFSATYAATPLLGAAVDFTNGAGIWNNASDNIIVFDSVADLTGNTYVMQAWPIFFNSGIAGPTFFLCQMNSRDVNGTTKNRAEIALYIETGAVWTIDVANIPAGNTLIVGVRMFITPE